jgi:hypothetical protein
MAAAATQQIIANGPRNLVLKYTIAGTTGDLTASKLVDISALDSGLGVNGLTLMSVQWSLTGFSANLLWDATTDVPIIECSAGADSQDYSKFGGIKNNAGSGATGDVMITTTGYTAAGDGGHIYLCFRKT